MRILFFILFIPIFLIAQKKDIPVIDFNRASQSINPYVKLLRLKDESALILKASINENKKRRSGNYLVMMSSGKLYHYSVYISDIDTLVLQTPARKNDRKKLIDFFKTAATLDTVRARDYSYNIIMDTPVYQIGVYQKNNSFDYEAYSYDEEYLAQEKAMGATHQKILTMYNALDYKQYLDVPELETIKALDTVYVHFTHAAMQAIEIPGNDHKYPASYMFYHNNFSHEHFFELREKTGQENIINIDRNFLKEHKKAIVNYDFFLKYRWQLQFLRKKTVYIIDDNGERLFMKKVQYTPINLFNG